MSSPSEGRMNHNHTHEAGAFVPAFLMTGGNMSIYYEDDAITLHHGDALEVASTLDDGSVDCIVTSPPYYGLRDYGSEGQYGLEKSPAAFVETMRALFSELRRVLADDGTLWLNIGDSYGKSKQLMGIPWRVALALQEDGWVLRNDIIWAKPNPMPESVKDRMARSHEHVFLLSKKPKYFFNAAAVAEPLAPSSVARLSQNVAAQAGSARANGGAKTNGNIRAAGSLSTGMRNRRDVWQITTQPFAAAHFATMPPELARVCILAGSRPGGIILDPFSGAGTTGMVARQESRNYVGVDISADYLKLSLETRLQKTALDFGGAA